MSVSVNEHYRVISVPGVQRANDLNKPYCLRTTSFSHFNSWRTFFDCDLPKSETGSRVAYVRPLFRPNFRMIANQILIASWVVKEQF